MLPQYIYKIYDIYVQHLAHVFIEQEWSGCASESHTLHEIDSFGRAFSKMQYSMRLNAAFLILPFMQRTASHIMMPFVLCLLVLHAKLP